MLIFLSDFTQNNNTDLIKLVNQKFKVSNYNLSYISATTDADRTYFNIVSKFLEEFGNFSCTYYDFDKEFDSSKTDQLFSADIIYLSGGFTPRFLEMLRNKNVIDRFKTYVAGGGSLIGASAGSIIMTDNIYISSFCEDDLSQLEDLTGFSLVYFEFMPHWEEYANKLEEIKAYSLNNARPIYTCCDGDGIVVNEDGIHFCGNLNKIENGIITKINYYNR